MEKVIKDGKVAVLYSPGFGAGWYSWNTQYPDMVFDKDIVEAVLAGDMGKAAEIAAEKFPDAYLGGACDLTVEWLEEGSQFEIEEYDGSESLHVIGQRRYLTA